MPFARTHIGEIQTHPVDAGRSPYAQACGVGIGVGETVGEGEGVAVGVGVGVGVGVAVGAGVAVGLGVGVNTGASQTANLGFTCSVPSTFDTDGFANVGIDWPPVIIVAVPVGETYMTFEFCALTVEQGALQKVNVGTVVVGDAQVPEVAAPR